MITSLWNIVLLLLLLSKDEFYISDMRAEPPRGLQWYCL